MRSLYEAHESVAKAKGGLQPNGIKLRVFEGRNGVVILSLPKGHPEESKNSLIS